MLMDKKNISEFPKKETYLKKPTTTTNNNNKKTPKNNSKCYLFPEDLCGVKF